MANDAARFQLVQMILDAILRNPQPVRQLSAGQSGRCFQMGEDSFLGSFLGRFLGTRYRRFR
jgi:hypothetical protein